MIQEKDKMASEIKAIMETYGIADFEIPDKLNPKVRARASRRIAGYMLLPLAERMSNAIETNRLELAKLIKFLRECKGSRITLQGLITKPQGKNLKGTYLKTQIADKHFLSLLEQLANTWLESEQDGLFQYLFGWDFKQPVTYINKEGEEEYDSFFTDPYSDQEIDQIISYYDSREKRKKKLSIFVKLGNVASRIISSIGSATKDWTQTKLYSFVYDVMLVGEYTDKASAIEEGFSGGIGREKTQKVRYWIKAFNDFEKK